MTRIRSESLSNSYAQFIIDLPRLTLYLDGEISKRTPEEVVDYLFDKLDDNKQVKFCVYFLTQTSLADYYIAEYKKLKKEEEHLVDDGSYIVRLDTALKTINISKNFRKIYFENDVNFELDFANLNLNHDLDTATTCYDWEYGFQDDLFNPVFIE